VKAFRRSRCPRWCRCSRRRCTPQLRSVLPPLLVHGLPFFRCGARRGAPLPWPAGGHVLPWTGAAAAPSPASSHGALTDRVEGKTPMGLVAVDNWPSPSPLVFEPRRRKGQGEFPGLPRLGPPGRPRLRRLLTRGAHATEIERVRWAARSRWAKGTHGLGRLD
jgi:hypothetical protein